MSVSTSLKKLNRIKYNRTQYVPKDIIVMTTLHLIPLLAIFTGAGWFEWSLCIGLYFARMFFITGGYHRYFAHRSYKTSRWFQFFLAFMAQTSMQKGALWWAANHRVHHHHSDDLEDPHSMKHYGFLHSHIGWIFIPNFKKTKVNIIRDFAKYPELRWLNRNHVVPPLTLMIAVALAGGFYHFEGTTESFLIGAASSLLIGFFLSTVILYHGTYSINSLMHLIGNKRYNTPDNSRNNFFLALLTMGEGWHNNHHYYMASARQGFFWWEIDITYYILKIFSFLGLIWDINPVPDKVKNNH